MTRNGRLGRSPAVSCLTTTTADRDKPNNTILSASVFLFVFCSAAHRLAFTFKTAPQPLYLCCLDSISIRYAYVPV